MKTIEAIKQIFPSLTLDIGKTPRGDTHLVALLDDVPLGSATIRDEIVWSSTGMFQDSIVRVKIRTIADEWVMNETALLNR